MVGARREVKDKGVIRSRYAEAITVRIFCSSLFTVDGSNDEF